MSSTLDAAGRPLKRVHFRTGHISLQDFLRVLIRDFDVRPRPQYENDYDAILNDTERALRALEAESDD